MKFQEGSRRCKKVLEGSRRVKQDQGVSKMFQKVPKESAQEGSRMFKKVQDGSMVQEVSRRLQKVQTRLQKVHQTIIYVDSISSKTN